MRPAAIASCIACAGLASASAFGAEAACAEPEAYGLLVTRSAWRETTMRDGKPLTLSVSDRRGRLFIRFVKAGEGLWAEGTAEICAIAQGVQARLRRDDLALGPGASWFTRKLLERGATFDIVPLADGRLRVATAGWSGDFVPE